MIPLNLRRNHERTDDLLNDLDCILVALEALEDLAPDRKATRETNAACKMRAYTCETLVTAGARLNDRSDWEFLDDDGQALGAHSPDISMISFGGLMTVGSAFYIEAFSQEMGRYVNYHSVITGRSQEYDDRIIYYTGSSTGVISASQTPAGMQYAGQVTWNDCNRGYSTSYLCCSYLAPYPKKIAKRTA